MHFGNVSVEMPQSIFLVIKENGMKKLLKLGGILALAGLLAVQPGCMTLDHLLDPKQSVSMYGGTVSSYREIEDENTGKFGTLCRLIDLPLTIVADTLLLLVTVPMELSR